MASETTSDRTKSNGSGGPGKPGVTTRAAELGDALRAAGSGIGDAAGTARTPPLSSPGARGSSPTS